MMHTHLRDEFELLLRIGALTQDELDETNLRGHESSFVRGGFRAVHVWHRVQARFSSNG
jgi:hypothetical protein